MAECDEKAANQIMNDKLVEGLKNLETHADVLMKIPASEQYISHIQSVVSIALLEIKRCLESLYDEVTPTPENESRSREAYAEHVSSVEVFVPEPEEPE